VLVLGVGITEVLDIVSDTDTILFGIWRSLWDGVLCVGYPLWCWVLCIALTSLVYGDHYLGTCCHCTDDDLHVGLKMLFHQHPANKLLVFELHFP